MMNLFFLVWSGGPDMAGLAGHASAPTRATARQRASTSYSSSRPVRTRSLADVHTIRDNSMTSLSTGQSAEEWISLQTRAMFAPAGSRLFRGRTVTGLTNGRPNSQQTALRGHVFGDTVAAFHAAEVYWTRRVGVNRTITTPRPLTVAPGWSERQKEERQVISTVTTFPGHRKVDHMGARTAPTPLCNSAGPSPPSLLTSL